MAWAWFKGSNFPQMRLFTLYKNISPLTICHVWTDAIRKLKQRRFERCTSTGSETIFFNMLWRCQVWNDKGVFSHTDDLSEILSKTAAQECKRSTSVWLASLKSLSTVNHWTDFKCGHSLRLIYAVSLRVLVFIHFLFWKCGKRIIARATRDIFKKDLRVHVYSADTTTGGKGSETT